MRLTIAFAVSLIFLGVISWVMYRGGFITGSISLSDFVSYVGLLITVFAFTIGCYFAVVAVTAYAHIRDIEEAAKSTKEYMHTLKKAVGEAEERSIVFTSYITNSSTIISEYIAAVGSERANEYVGRLHAIRQRFAFSDSRDDATKIRVARDLISLGDASDLEMIRKFLDGRREQDAHELLSEIETKLKTLKKISK